VFMPVVNATPLARIYPHLIIRVPCSLDQKRLTVFAVPGSSPPVSFAWQAFVTRVSKP
jgi:hypothetical protein